MPKNKLIYWGVLVAVGAALLWIGAVFLAQIKQALPYFVAAGVLLIILGVFVEIRKNKLDATETAKRDEP